MKNTIYWTSNFVTKEGDKYHKYMTIALTYDKEIERYTPVGGVHFAANTEEVDHNIYQINKPCYPYNATYVLIFILASFFRRCDKYAR